MDPEKLNSIYSKAICSSAITRQNLSRKMLMPPTIDNKNDEDDAQFFENLKKKINIGSLKYFQKKYEPKRSYTTRKKKRSFHEETTNIIKRFKETIEHKNHIEVDAIKLTSQTNKICEDNITSCSNSNNTTEQCVNKNVDNECCMLSRDFTIIFQPEKVSIDEENNQSKFIKSYNMIDTENNSIKHNEMLSKK